MLKSICHDVGAGGQGGGARVGGVHAVTYGTM